MNKAFTKDDADDPAIVVPPRASLPPGVPNYVTPGGLAALRVERTRLETERANLLRAEEDADRIRSAAILAARLADLDDRIASAKVVDPSTQPKNEVRFGATVGVRDDRGVDRHYRIVGADEADVTRGDVAFVSPIAKALLGRAKGDIVELRTPRGSDELEILTIEYDGAGG